MPEVKALHKPRGDLVLCAHKPNYNFVLLGLSIRPKLPSPSTEKQNKKWEQGKTGRLVDGFQ